MKVPPSFIARKWFSVFIAVTVFAAVTSLSLPQPVIASKNKKVNRASGVLIRCAKTAARALET